MADDDALRRTFATLADDELLRRWQGPLTDQARHVARDEIEHRGLHATEAALELLRAQDAEDRAAFRQGQRERGKALAYNAYRANRVWIWAIAFFGALAIAQQLYQALTGP